jgi:hypothetical protein
LFFKSLVGILVKYSLQVSETELLLKIADLVGQYCNFEPALPLTTVTLSSSFNDLADLITKARSSQKVLYPAPLTPSGICC